MYARRMKDLVHARLEREYVDGDRPARIRAADMRTSTSSENFRTSEVLLTAREFVCVILSSDWDV